MNLIIRYMQEYVAITDFLQKYPQKIIKEEKGVLYVKKAVIEELLRKNNYDTAEKKLNLWKKLGWIKTEKNRLKKRVYDKELGKYIYCLQIDCKMQKLLKQLLK